MTKPAPALGVVVAILAATLLSCSGGGSVDDAAVETSVDAGASACPAAGHGDTYASGLTPDRIPTLPNGYSFTFVKGDGCTPVRFDPCQPIHYVLNPAEAPTTGVADVEEAFRRLAGVTGMTFVNDGVTDETSRRGPFVSDRYPDRWAPILVTWNRQSGDRLNLEVVGSGIPYPVQGVLVSGVLSLNSDAVIDRARTRRCPAVSDRLPGSGPSAQKA